MKTLPEITEGQYLELVYTVDSVGTKTINSIYQPAISYRFSSPGNISRAMKKLHIGSRKLVVMTIEEVIDSRQVYYEDALKLTEFIEMGRNSFVLSVVDIPVEEVVTDNIEKITSDVIEEPPVEEPLVEDIVPDDAKKSIVKMKKYLAENEVSEAVLAELITEENARKKPRVQMLALFV